MRIGIVNDMALAREALRRVVQSSTCHQVAWLASDGRRCGLVDPPGPPRPDPHGPGHAGDRRYAEATRRIMAESPCPILVVTSTVSGHFQPGSTTRWVTGALDAASTRRRSAPGATSQGAEALLGQRSTRSPS